MIYLGNQPVGNTEVIGSFTPGAMASIEIKNEVPQSQWGFRAGLATSAFDIQVQTNRIWTQSDLFDVSMQADSQPLDPKAPAGAFICVCLKTDATHDTPYIDAIDTSYQPMTIDAQQRLDSGHGNYEIYITFQIPEGANLIGVYLYSF